MLILYPFNSVVSYCYRLAVWCLEEETSRLYDKMNGRSNLGKTESLVKKALRMPIEPDG